MCTRECPGFYYISSGLRLLEQIAQLIGPQWQLSFYRTASGAEMDIVAECGTVANGYPLAPNVEVVPATELANVLQAI